MTVRAISGYGIKGPACFLTELGGRRFLLDLGEGPQPGLRPDLSGLGAIDAVLISHSHHDHVGSLDLLGEIGDPPVYATDIVRALKPHPALLSARSLPLHGRLDILGVEVETGRASHAPGGIWMRLGGEDGVLYTGDWTRESVLYPLDPMPPARSLICDSAYGFYDEPLADGIADLVALAGAGPLLLPMPPAGRGLDAAIVLSGHGFDVRLCPAHRRVAELLLERFAESLDGQAAASLADMLQKSPPADADQACGGVMIAASADAESGCAATLAKRFSASGEAAIVFTGHVPKGGFADMLLASGKARFRRWNVHPRAGDVAWLLDTVRPEIFMPAFLAGPDLAGFEARR